MVSNIYENKNYKLLLVLPLLLMAASLYLVFGVGLTQGIDLRGGLLFTVFTNEGSTAELVVVLPDAEIRSFDGPGGRGFEIQLPNNPDLEQAEVLYKELISLDSDLARAEVTQGEEATVVELNQEISSRFSELSGLVGFSGVAPSDAHKKLELVSELFSSAKSEYRQELVSKISSVVTIDSYSFKEVGSSLSKFFLNKTSEIVLWSFILSSILVFIIFRKLAPSLAVIFGVVADIVITLGAMVLFNIPLSLASVAALLMLIGFSLDTDVMLTVRVIKRKEGTPVTRVWNALKTGLLMNITTVVAFGVLTLLAITLQIPTYYQIGAVAVIGGAVDFVATWAGNAVLILWSLEGNKHESA
ncbi:MAG: hypothetical protein ABH803_03835 [Candidatus Micrarchaeota archaeon]